jgi:hypothetical protein
MTTSTTPTPFDQAAFVDLYRPHGATAIELAEKLCSMHLIVIKALDSIDSKIERLKSFNATFEGFNIDIMREVPEARDTYMAVLRQDNDIQQMGATSVAKCVGVLDLTLRGQGVGADECQAITHLAFQRCLLSTPARVHPAWSQYFETVGLALATAGPNGALPPSAGSSRI